MNRLEAMKDPVQRAAIERQELLALTKASQEHFSCLKNWPVQIKLAPVRAAFFNGCKLLIAADCTAYAHGDFHIEFMKNSITLIGCAAIDCNCCSCSECTSLGYGQARFIMNYF